MYPWTFSYYREFRFTGTTIKKLVAKLLTFNSKRRLRAGGTGIVGSFDAIVALVVDLAVVQNESMRAVR